MATSYATKTERLMRSWQKDLRLNDWDITISVHPTLPNKSWGSALSHQKMREATLKVKSGMTTKDLEETIVHELIHVIFPNISDAHCEPTHVLNYELEVGIEQLARALVRLKHA